MARSKANKHLPTDKDGNLINPAVSGPLPKGCFMFTDGWNLYYDYLAAEDTKRSSLSDLTHGVVHELVHIWLDHTRVYKRGREQLRLKYGAGRQKLIDRAILLSFEPVANYIPAKLGLKSDYGVVDTHTVDSWFGIRHSYRMSAPELAEVILRQFMSGNFGMVSKKKGDSKSGKDGSDLVPIILGIVERGWKGRIAEAKAAAVSLAPFLGPLLAGDGESGDTVHAYGCLILWVRVRELRKGGKSEKGKGGAKDESDSDGSSGAKMDEDQMDESSRELVDGSVEDGFSAHLADVAIKLKGQDDRNKDRPDQCESVSDAVREAIRQEVDQAFASAGKLAGIEPGDLEELIRYRKRRTPPSLFGWLKNTTGKFIQGRDQSSWSVMPRRDRKESGILLPGTVRRRHRVVVVVDCSGSMTDLIRHALGAAKWLVDRPEIEGEILAYDTKLQELQINTTYAKVKGFGGTDMGRAIEDYRKQLMRKELDGLLIITDGYTPWPRRPVPNVFAILVDDDAQNPPQWIRSFRLRVVPEW